MSVTIGHASIDENGKVSGGTAGDQTGKEVCTRSWYANSWSVLLRPTTTALAEKLATACEAGCKNDKIGYDQYQRNTLRTQAKAVNWDLSKITTACETDCSAFMTVCLECAGVNVDSLYTSGNAPVTQTMRTKFVGTGRFTALTDSKYLTSDAYLKRGDILVKESGHTAMVLSNGSKVSGTGTTTATTTTTTTKVDVAKSGPDKSLAGIYTVTVKDSGLKLRSGAGTDKDVLAVLANGTSVKNYGYYTETNGVKWLLVLAGGITGFVHSGYLTKK
jgi:hypothetical protein